MNDGGRDAHVACFDTPVLRVQDVGPHVRRITFGGPELERFGVPEPALDLRVKLLLPTSSSPVPGIGETGVALPHDWYQQWLLRPEPGRGAIRSYTVRGFRRGTDGFELDVDFVVREAGGPGSTWARSAVPGSRALIIGPTSEAAAGALAHTRCGITWTPGPANDVLLAGDETAVPAITAMLETLPARFTGNAFLEVPDAGDVQQFPGHPGIRTHWLIRNSSGVGHGQLLLAAVKNSVTEQERGPEYAWIAGEASVVTGMRRYLVRDRGMDRNNVTFRGYWSAGKSGSGVNGIPDKPRPGLNYSGSDE
ncbi:siderophore-interacting protein [Arthrobacter rhizosphaerae]|uniref:siderophore-interacting protein n=1 Tax=Arthrobacter rhizosphaerae TaxID=2855490 RepID=UPI001FF1BB40|nr:siderophore-interacting protein [Arthrobacter rhizosphaerae]